MKSLKGQVLLIAVLSVSIVSIQMNAVGIPQGMQLWWKTTYFTDYLPNWVQSFIPRARVRQMFYGVLAYSEKIRELSMSCNQIAMNKLVKNYTAWMSQYKDIINEGTIFSGLSRVTGNPDSVLGVWKLIFGMYYDMNENNVCILSGIKKIIKNLEVMGAKVHELEEKTLGALDFLINKG